MSRQGSRWPRRQAPSRCPLPKALAGSARVATKRGTSFLPTRVGAAVAGGFDPRERRRRLGPSDLLDVRRGADGGVARRIPEARRPAPRGPRERSPGLLEGTRVAASVRLLQGGRGDRRRGAVELSQAGQPPRGASRSVLPWVDVATGSLGQGLPIGVGLALAAKRLDRLPARVWVLCGDGELAEGSIWEAFEHASHEELDNLTAIVDVNRLGQTGETMHGWDLGAYSERARAFGWQAIELDGHDVEAIDEAFARAVRTGGRPTVVLAGTLKGRGVREVEDLPDKHGKPLPHSCSRPPRAERRTRWRTDCARS